MCTASQLGYGVSEINGVTSCCVHYVRAHPLCSEHCVRIQEGTQKPLDSPASCLVHHQQKQRSGLLERCGDDFEVTSWEARQAAA